MDYSGGDIQAYYIDTGERHAIVQLLCHHPQRLACDCDGCAVSPALNAAAACCSFCQTSVAGCGAWTFDPYTYAPENTCWTKASTGKAGGMQQGRVGALH